ncbi:hypothetical protein ACFO0N_13065 [Halobium salinum]|uniref:Phosphatidate cytidylyltransferase n=1 Tax=Halobium salinum TaxID=1364940 RepID=A0ABD5PDR8_9EURY|nr:hypothetical protein [Halobium salinum]
MPSTTQSKNWKIATAVAVLAVLAYAVVVASQLLLGAILATAVYLVSWLAAYVKDNGYPRSLGPRRTWLVAVLSTLVFLYAIVIAGQVLLGLLAVALIALVAWVTSPTGPLASR